MAGANMSGELKSPGRSIPTGTLSAVAFTFVCYVLLSFFISATTTPLLLKNNNLFLMPVNLFPLWVFCWQYLTTKNANIFFRLLLHSTVAIGILTATFSTGLSNLIGSSRVLEAMAKDRVYGALLDFVSRGTYKSNPIVAVLLSWSLVECILLIGSLNLIAQINAVLFMLSYMATNLACLGIEITGAPNFRPTFKYFTWHTCFFGLMGTLIMMFVINAIYASLSIIMCLILIICLHIFSPISQKTDSGSISQALMFHQVRKYLLMLDSRKDHVKFWRPQMLLLVSSPRTACPLIDFVNDLKKGGLYVLGHVKVGDFSEYEPNNDPTREVYGKWLSLIDHLKVKAFAEVTMARTIREGVQHLIRISGMGAMKPNTILLGFYDEENLSDFFLKWVHSAFGSEADFDFELFFFVEIRHPIKRTSSIKTTEKSFQFGRRANESIWVQRSMWRSFAMFCGWRKMCVCVGISIVWTNTRLLGAITSITSTYGPSMCSIPATTIHSTWCPCSCCNWRASLTCCRNGRNCICAYFCVNQTKRIVTGKVQVVCVIHML